MLLDTHVLIWLFEGDERLSQGARDLIEANRPSGSLLVSPIVFFETATLVRRRRVNLSLDFGRWVDAVLESPGIILAPIDTSIAGEAGLLPESIHGDPGDRILIATAVRRGVPLLTADGPILDYAAAGHLQAIDAQR